MHWVLTTRHKETPVVDETANHPGPFDVRTIKILVRLMAEHDLNEIDLRDGSVRIRLLRGSVIAAPVSHAPAAGAPPNSIPAVMSAATKEPPAAPSPTKKLLEIKSPSVGTFYASPNPEAPPFARVGERVTPATVVGLVEAMKTFNEIPADCSGVIVEQLVRNQQPIEFDTVLFRVDPGA
jgi:acetyl-CoA carboxylase biotin carboxyl carrier protein